MENFRLSFLLLVVFGFCCAVSGNPFSGLFGKSGDAETEAEDKGATTTTTTAKAAGEVTTTSTTTTTPEPSSSCGGLKGFLHMCEKTETTEPPKSVKTRSVDESDDSDVDSDDDDSDEDSEEKKKMETTTEAVAKRQVGDPEAPIVEEVPPVVEDAMAENTEQEEKPKEEEEEEEKTTDEVMESVNRRRRDCRDGDGEDRKNCRKKREYVPTCISGDPLERKELHGCGNDGCYWRSYSRQHNRFY